MKRSGNIYLNMIRTAVKTVRHIPKSRSKGETTNPKVAPVDARKYEG